MAEAAGGEEGLAAFLEAVVRDQFQAHPATARANGDHTRDGEVGPVGADAHRQRLERLRELRAKAPLPEQVADPDRRLDLETARSIVESELFSLEVRRRSFRDPTSLLDEDSPLDVGGYMLRDYAPLGERIAALCRQLEQARDWVEEALRTLDLELAEPLIELTLEGAEGQLTFLDDDVAPLAEKLDDPQLQRRLEAAIEIGKAGADRITKELGRRRRPEVQDVALGARGLEAMLLAQEGLERGVGELRTAVEAELESLQEERAQLLQQSFQGRGIAEVRSEIESDHFSADTLIAGADGLLGELRDFVESHAEVPIPEGPPCQVRPSPGFLSAWVSAAYEGVGPLEQRPLPALYYVTTPQPSWSEQESQEWLLYMNRATLKNTSVHEVYPGHHVQFLYSRAVTADVRRFFWSSGFGEGWAHYAELLMVERGLADQDPSLRLAQIEDALLRACRFRTTLGIHAEGWSVDEGTRFFIERTGVEELPARREALRATFDPLYLVYTLGKHEILRWRAEWLRSGRGDLRSFHRLVLSTGSPPLAALGRWLTASA